jgi:hypothetical protein
MGATAARVMFRDSGGEVIHSDLVSVSPVVLAAGRPWRTFRWHHGQVHFSGWYWAATMRRHVVYESRLELARLLLAGPFGGGYRRAALLSDGVGEREGAEPCP